MLRLVVDLVGDVGVVVVNFIITINPKLRQLDERNVYSPSKKILSTLYSDGSTDKLMKEDRFACSIDDQKISLLFLFSASFGLIFLIYRYIYIIYMRRKFAPPLNM